MDDGGQRTARQATGLLRAIPVGQIRPGPYQPRRTMDAGPLDELANSIREHGVLQPVVLRPSENGFELVAGERRWRAACQLGLTVIPAVVRELSDRDMAVLALVENLQREDLPFLEEAEGYRQLLEEFGLSQEELAGQIGKSQPGVANKLRLLRLEPSVRSRVVAGRLTERHARALLRLAGEGERLAAADAFIAGNMTVRAAEHWVARRLAAATTHDAPGTEGPVGRPIGGRSMEQHVRTVRSVAADLRRDGFAARVRQRAMPDGGWIVELRIGARADGGP